jgi:GDPmannose 4,6-dehydratase
MQWMMLQQNEPDDFVIDTGKNISVREFGCLSVKYLGKNIEFSGEDVNEIGTITDINGGDAAPLNVGDIIVKVDRGHFRPTEVETLLGEPTKEKGIPGLTPEITVEKMCAEMIEISQSAKPF